MKSMLKEPCLGCILSQHSCINPFFSIPHSGLPSWFLSGRVHLRLFKLTGCKFFHQHLFHCTGPLDNSASGFVFLLYKTQTIAKISFILKDKIPRSQSSKWHTSNKSCICSEPSSTKFNFNLVSYLLICNTAAVFKIGGKGLKSSPVGEPGPSAAVSTSWSPAPESRAGRPPEPSARTGSSRPGPGEPPRPLPQRRFPRRGPGRPGRLCRGLRPRRAARLAPAAAASLPRACGPPGRESPPAGGPRGRGETWNDIYCI